MAVENIYKQNASDVSTKTHDRIDLTILNQQNESDLKSVFLSNIDFEITPNEIEDFFQDCGEVVRITLFNNNKYIHRNHKQGFAYVEFDREACVEKALLLNGSILKGSRVKIRRKRTNIRSYHKKKGKRCPISNLSQLTSKM